MQSSTSIIEPKGENSRKHVSERCNFKENIPAGERLYKFHAGEEKDVQSAINKIETFLKGLTPNPEFKNGAGTSLVSQIIIQSNNRDQYEALSEYDTLHPKIKNLPQGKPNAKDRFLRMLSNWIECGAISVKDNKIQFEQILIKRLSSES